MGELVTPPHLYRGGLHHPHLLCLRKLLCGLLCKPQRPQLGQRQGDHTAHTGQTRCKDLCLHPVQRKPDRIHWSLAKPFVDVEEGRYYYTPVLWAVYAGVASGIDRTHFMPEQTCTRGQVVTFLWRAKGCPAPESAQCPFLDVTPKRYYYDAVLWAAEQGITAGVDATHFNPEGVVTRGQLVTFLWRAGGCPAVSGRNPFVDVTQDRFYYDAVLWAAARGITLGIDATHFMPNRSCTRGRSPPSSSGSRKDNLAPVGISEGAMATSRFIRGPCLYQGPLFPLVAHRVHFSF